MLARLRSLAAMTFRRSQWERDLRDEFNFHIEERADALERTGLTRDEARRRARIEFRSMETTKEECREARGARWVDEISRNLTCAMRSIRQHPGFSSVAIISLALGIGANLAVFGVLHRLMLTPLPVRDPGGLYQVAVVTKMRTSYSTSYPKYEVIRDNFDIFESLFGWGGIRRTVSTNGWRQVEQVSGVTGNFFQTLGVQPAIGRLFTPADESAKTADLAVISHRLWQSAYGSDPAVVGRSVEIDGKTFSIVGVASAEFRGFEPANPPSLYLTLHGYERLIPAALKGPGNQWFHPIARLRAGVPLAHAQALLRDRWAQLDEPNRLSFMRNSRDFLSLESGRSGYSAVGLEFSGALLVLMGLVAAVFLIACANVATLLLVRGADRVREMSIRLALGASRAQLIRQWLTECMLLAAAGGAIGVISARWLTEILLLFVNPADRDWLRFEQGPWVAFMTIALTFAAAAACGIIPAIRVTSEPLDMVVRAHGASGVRRGLVAQYVLAGQIAASLVLVVGGAMFARTLWNLNNADPGYDRRSVVYALPDFSKSAVPRERRAALVGGVVDRLRESPWVASATIGDAPMISADSGWNFVFDVKDYTFGPDEDNTAWQNAILPDYFDVMGIGLVAGRNFDESDRPRPSQLSRVVIINEHMARHYFAGRTAVGQFIKLYKADGQPVEIIGVVKDAKNTALRGDARDTFYRPVSEGGWGTVLVRAKEGIAPETLTPLIRERFSDASDDITVDATALESAVQKSLGRDRLVAQLSAAFAALGVLLAAIGLYAAISHAVSSRTREIGIRIAIGAATRDVLWMVLKQAAIVTTAGLAIGLPLAIASSYLVRDLLFEVSPTDPLTLGGCTLLLAATGLAAGLRPARRAAELDPCQALRSE